MCCETSRVSVCLFSPSTSLVLAGKVDVDLERVVDLGQVVDAELDVDHWADDAGDPADAGAVRVVALVGSLSTPSTSWSLQQLGS